MREEFKLGFGKKYGFTNYTFFYGKEEYPYSQCSPVQIFQAALNYRVGMADLKINGKNYSLTFTLEDTDRFINAVTYMNQKVDEANGIKKNYVCRILAYTGTIMEVYNDYLTINLMPYQSYIGNSFRGCGNGEKRINFSDITAIQYREPGEVPGYIQFSYPGCAERNGSFDAILEDENAIPIRKAAALYAKEILNFIEKRRAEIKQESKTAPAAVMTPISVADEIKKFKELLDLGVITQEEFNAKKKELLGL